MDPPPPGDGGHPPQQPQWTAPPQIDQRRLRPTRAWYWLASIPAVAGLILTAVFVVQIVGVFSVGLERLSVPGSVIVPLEGGDKRGIYVQTYGLGGALPGVTNTDLACTVGDAGSDRSVPVTRTPGAVTLTIGTAQYVERLRFEAPRDGRYAVMCSQPPGVRSAVGPRLSFFGPFVAIVGAILSPLIGLALSAAIAIVVAVWRSAHKKRLRAEAGA